MEREDWNRRHGEAEAPLFGVEPNRFLAAEVAGLAPGRALAVACGAGRNAVWLAGNGWTVTGVDFSDVALEHARRLADDRGVEVEWVQADVREWVPAAAAFDLVAILYLHVPVEERRVVHGLAAAAVAPGGTLLIVGHDRENLTSGTGGPQDALLLLDATEVTAELGALAIERAERVLRPVEGERDAIDTLVRARRA
jgi:2-polyprenyl-3-methyl-5-hydroxy-6-metoxy-1,4-benzoquinol methylase